MASGRYERRAARQGIAAAHQSLETAKRLARFGQIAGAVGNVIGIIDAFSMLADAEKAERQGELSQFTDNMYLLVGVNVVGAVVGLIFSSVVIPLLISLFAIWIAGQIIHYVPLGIRVWVRRSIFGVPGRQEAPFASLEEEQESLEMVIRGISVDIDVIQRWRRIGDAGPIAAFEQADHQGEEPYCFSLKVSLPDYLSERGVFVTVSQFVGDAEEIQARYVMKKPRGEASGASNGGSFDRDVAINDEISIEKAFVSNGEDSASAIARDDLSGFPESVQVRVELLPRGGEVRDQFTIAIKRR